VIGNWLVRNASNYSLATALPTQSTPVVIPANQTCIFNQPTISSGTEASDNLTIDPSASLTLSPGATLNLSGNVSNNGTLSNSGTINVEGSWTNNGSFFSGASSLVVFNGNSGNNTLSGNNTFNNLTINGASSLVVNLQNDANVNGTLTMGSGSNGKLNLSSYTLTVGTSSSIGNITGGSSTSFVIAVDNGIGSIGKVKRFVNNNTSYVFPIGDDTGYTPLTYSQTNATIANGAFLEVYTRATKIPQLNTSTISNYLKRYWEVNPSGITSPTYNIEYTYLDGDIQGSETDLVPIKYSVGTWFKPPNNSFTTGTIQGAAFTLNATNNLLNWSGLTSFSEFSAAGNTIAPLPIELVSFQSNCVGDDKINVSWTTATEYNSSHYIVEHSRNGNDWDVLSMLDAAGNSTTLLNYTYVHENPNAGINYYRLIQYDNDGLFEIFDPKSAECQGKTGTYLSSYPNPSSEDFNLDLQTDELEGEATLIITDAKGALIYSQDIEIIKGNNNYVIHKFNAEPGFYYITVKSGAITVNTKHSLR
jgi:hypothetical protein